MKKIGSQVLVLVLYLWGKLSFSVVQRLGWFIGTLFFYLNSDMRRVARINIDKCFPELSEYHKKKLLKETLQQTCMTGAEMPGILFKSPQKLLQQIQVCYGEKLMQELYEQGRGVLLVAPHLGSYEIASMYISSKYPSAMLYTPPKIKVLDRLILQARSRLCKNMSPANHKGVKIIFKALANKEVIAMLTDQVPVDAGGSYIDFFGHPAKTMNFPDKLYKRYKPAVVLSYAVRNSIGKGLTLYIEDLEPLIKQYQAIEGMKDPVAYAFTRRFEEIIRQYPAQYQWTYKRFKYHPQGVDFYK
ncbi:lysophospholipid acyltransferase family protein [Caedibacter taeniospiralis]|jgi:KDO2-lipid IV(A) lauroyltransferase|uniref:lysophospholipid acyltransferase family protein n=1 Tax=Caedibacter taeniospiralis TaxID=28907 RepID=UPI0037C0F35D